jgi:hypothetical protein
MNKTIEIYLKILLHILWFLEDIVDRIYPANRFWISYRLEQRFCSKKVSKEFIDLLERAITEESKNEKVDDLDKFLNEL